MSRKFSYQGVVVVIICLAMLTFYFLVYRDAISKRHVQESLTNSVSK